MDKRVFLLDAFALIFRAYYALIRSPRISSTGKNTNAQFGFTNALVELINKQKPSHLAVCFDTKSPTERHIDFADYKANRQETPEDILAAVPDIKAIIRGFNIPIIEMDGFEADDIIGTLSKQAEAAGYEVMMVTPDKDYGQLVSDKIKIYKPSYQGNGVEILGPEEVCAKWNIKNVDQVIDMLGMMGDAVDNIPGIPGVGEKTAAKLLAEFETLENVLANADQIKGAMGEKVRNGKELAVLSKKLATILTNVPVSFHEEDFRLKEWNKEALRDVFTNLEFRTLGKRLLGEDIPSAVPTVIEKEIPRGVQTDLFGNIIEPAVTEKTLATEEVHVSADRNIQNTPHDYRLVDSDEKINELIDLLSKHDEICFDTETTDVDANRAELVGLAFSVQTGAGWYVPCPNDTNACKELIHRFKPLFENPAKSWVGQNIKYDLLILKWMGVDIRGPIFDTMLAHYVDRAGWKTRHGFDE
jgi:DNA polymerase-1